MCAAFEVAGTLVPCVRAPNALLYAVWRADGDSRLYPVTVPANVLRLRHYCFGGAVLACALYRIAVHILQRHRHMHQPSVDRRVMSAQCAVGFMFCSCMFRHQL